MGQQQSGDGGDSSSSTSSSTQREDEWSVTTTQEVIDIRPPRKKNRTNDYQVTNHETRILSPTQVTSQSSRPSDISEPSAQDPSILTRDNSTSSSAPSSSSSSSTSLLPYENVASEFLDQVLQNAMATRDTHAANLARLHSQLQSLEQQLDHSARNVQQEVLQQQQQQQKQSQSFQQSQPLSQLSQHPYQQTIHSPPSPLFSLSASSHINLSYSYPIWSTRYSSESSSSGDTSSTYSGCAKTGFYLHQRKRMKEMSRALLDQFLQMNFLNTLEDGYRTGIFTFEDIKQHLGFIWKMLEKDDSEFLMQKFADIKLSSNKSNSSSSHEPSPIQAALDSFPVYINSYCPTEPMEDDADGVPRLRFILKYQPATRPFRKRRQEEMSSEDEQKEEKVNHEPFWFTQDGNMGAIPSTTFTSNMNFNVCDPSRQTSHQTRNIVYRICYLNRAHERDFGFRQVHVRDELDEYGPRIVFRLMRSDHVKSFHTILAMWRAQGIKEGCLYQVLLTADGTEKYSLVHVRFDFIAGQLLDLLFSIRFLPNTDEYPVPPFVEGVDLSPEVQLNGFRRAKQLTSNVMTPTRGAVDPFVNSSLLHCTVVPVSES